jgi:two-component system nitrate/nitrite response regulator NarL
VSPHDASERSSHPRGQAPRLRLLVADDHPVYREGIVRVLERRPEFELVAEVGDGDEALKQIRRLSPDVAVVDLRLPHVDGIAVVDAVERDRLGTRVIILSAFEHTRTIRRAMACGARAYLPKVCSGTLLCETVLAVARGETVIPAAVRPALGREIPARRGHGGEPLLTPREIEILRLAADGLSAPQIATALALSVATVKTHLQHVYEKLAVSDRAAAVAQAMRRGLMI